MLFAAGIGAALLYWATIEWIDYFNILQTTNLDFDTALIYSKSLSNFSLVIYSMGYYCLPAIAFGLAITINQKSKLTFSGIFNLENRFLEVIFDTLFIGAILCGAGVG